MSGEAYSEECEEVGTVEYRPARPCPDCHDLLSPSDRPEWMRCVNPDCSASRDRRFDASGRLVAPWIIEHYDLQWPPAWPPFRSARMNRAIHEILGPTTRPAPGGFRGVIEDRRFGRSFEDILARLFGPDPKNPAECVGPVWECQHIHRTVEDAAECSAQAIEQLVAVAP